MSKRILPSLSVFSIVWKVIHDPFVDTRKWQHFLLRTLNSHSRQSDIRIRRFSSNVRTSTWSRHCVSAILVTELIILFSTQMLKLVCQMDTSAFLINLWFVYHFLSQT